MYKQQEEAEKKKTIGYFLAELRKRVDVDDSLDELLVDFLNNRNSFVHDLSSFEAWDFHKNKSALQSKKLVFDFMKQTDKVMKIFAGLILSWQEQVQTQTDRLGPVLPNHEWFNEVDSVYKPLMDRLFFAKD